MGLPNLEDPAWNAKREVLEKDLERVLLQVLDHMGWPAGVTLPLGTIQIEVKISPRSSGNARTN